MSGSRGSWSGGGNWSGSRGGWSGTAWSGGHGGHGGWSGGHGHGGWSHGGWHGGHNHWYGYGSVYLGWPWYWWGWPYYGYYGYGYPAYSTYYGYPYYNDYPAYYDSSTDVYVEKGTAPAAPQAQYYCPDTGYYPSVQTCPRGWLRVVPGSPPPR
jgi:hypothetical protein